MHDREKVIRGVEAIYDEAYSRWVHEQHIMSDKLIKLISEVVPDALALLREQEPVEPKKADAWPSMITLCGSCGSQIPTPGGWRYKYCPTCGRRIKLDA